MDVMIATEDELSEVVIERLLADLRQDIHITERLGRHGNQYLKSKVPSFMEIARHIQAVILLTDLDSDPCPVELIGNWCGPRPIPSRMLFRVAVREIEAWLLADCNGVAELLGVPHQKIPSSVEEEMDPKALLLRLAKKGKKREICRDILPASGAVASQGFGYNRVLAKFVRERWNHRAAAEVSPSFQRAIDRIINLH